jgi:hypothetical protein
MVDIHPIDNEFGKCVRLHSALAPRVVFFSARVSSILGIKDLAIVFHNWFEQISLQSVAGLRLIFVLRKLSDWVAVEVSDLAWKTFTLPKHDVIVSLVSEPVDWFGRLMV